MLFSQLGNVGAFADALCYGQVLCSPLLDVKVFCRNTRLGEDFWVFIAVDNQKAYISHKLASAVDWLMKILYLMHLKSGKKKKAK